jgi:hypothetical protein
LLACWRQERLQGKPVMADVLLPETIMKAATALAQHLKVPVEDAIRDAIAARMVSAGLAKVKPAEKRGD